MKSKHKNGTKLPSLNDIKDAFLKMVLFTNLQNVSVNGKIIKYKIALNLTNNCSELKELISKQKVLLKKILAEAKANKFVLMVNNEILEELN